MAQFKHFQLLLWKNFVIQKRHPVATVVQLLVPLVLAFVLVIIRQKTDTITYNRSTNFDELPLSSCSLSIQTTQGGGGTDAQRSDGIDNATMRVTYAPSNDAVHQVMNQLVARIQPPIQILGFSTEQDLVQFTREQSNSSIDVVSLVFVNVANLSDLKSGDITFKIRFPIIPKKSMMQQKDDWLTQFTFPTIQSPGPRNPGVNDGGSPYYCTKGFLSVQHEVSMAIATVINGGVKKDNVGVSIKRYPYPPYYNDLFLMAIRSFLPLIIMLSFLYPAFDLVKNLVLEKEKSLKESMKIMGLSGWLHWVSWFTKSWILFTISATFVAILLSYGFGDVAVLVKSDGSLIFVFLILYVFCGICFCCMLSTFFSKANSAATAAGIIWFFSYVPYFFLDPRYDTLTYWQKMFSCLLCNTCMAFGSMQVSLNEGSGFGLQWRFLTKPVTPDDNFSMMNVFGMLIFDSFLYLLITWYVDAVFPGEFGMPQPWYFPFQKRYWCTSRDKIAIKLPDTSQLASAEYFENEPTNLKAGVQIQGLTKVFNKSKIAVNNLNLNMYEDQITVLLGHNGAGKTTTMSILTGLFPPSQGEAYINGYGIHNDIAAVRRSLGLCPQHNVLFDDLTVEEHLYFACKLKSCDSKTMKAEIENMLVATNLVDKRNNMSSTLSGGMKRRLCVGMAFVGGSKVVMLDEPTSGMDPAARRFTWELLQSQCKGRTILLTTHFMDEADILGHRIAIMANGQLQCSGTPMFLKKKYGAGYHMIIVKEPNCDVKTIKALVKGIIPRAEIESNIGSELSFVLPHSSSSNFPKLFGQIEERKKQLKISSYGASVTTMEEVFLRVGEQSDSSLKKIIQSDEDEAKGRYQQFEPESHHAKNNNRKHTSPSISVRMDHLMPKYRNRGCKLIMQQFWAMMVKRMLHTQRNWLLMLVQFVIPIVITILILLVVNTTPSENLSPPLKLNLKPFQWSTVTYASQTDDGKQLASLYASQFDGTVDTTVNANNSSVELDNYFLRAAMNDTYNYNMHSIVGGTFSESSDTPGQMSVVAWFNNQPYHSPGIAMAAVDTALMRYYTGNKQLRLTVVNEPLPQTFEAEVRKQIKEAKAVTQGRKKGGGTLSVLSSTTKAAQSQVVTTLKPICTIHMYTIGAPQNFGFKESVPISGQIPSEDEMMKLADTFAKDTMTGFQISFNVMFGMSFLVSSFVVFLVKERSCDAKHLQFVSGVNPTTFWASTFAWDFVNFIVPCLGVMLVFVAYGQQGYSEGVVQGSMLLLFCSYGWSILPFTYLASFMFDVASTAYARVIMFNIFSGVVTLITVSILSLLDDLHDTAVTMDWIFLALPNYCLGGAMKNLYTQYRARTFCGKYAAFAPLCSCDNWFCLHRTDSYLSWEEPGIGRNLVFLVMWGFVYFALVVFLEMGFGRRFMSFLYSVKLRRLKSGQGHVNPLMNGLNEDDDVAMERQRIRDADLGDIIENNTLVAKDLTKYYGIFKPFLAVNHLCVAVPKGECFGLLGINGAGKTSTFKMLTGDEIISDGDAFVTGYSVRRQMKMVRHNLGYCPQFDAIIDQMTGRETLVMFARLRGVPEGEIPTVVDTLSKNLLFAEHIDKLVKKYSGGNKRKLSTAVALIGDPPIVFLDEPTTGMDPLARRYVWDTISRVRDSGSSIILTSHSMEECDALCTRLAIMVNGMFRCLGSPQHLKNKFGKGYTLTAKIHQNEVTRKDLDTITRGLQTFITRTFAGSILKDQHQGMVHYQIPGTAMSWANIFGALEKAKEKFSLEDYSIGQTTLEQVFLSFTRQQQDGFESES